MIEIKNLHKTIKGREILTDFSLSVEEGKILALIGPSGCGKTSLLRLIAGLDIPDNGIINIDGVVANNPESLLLPNKRKLGMIFQDLALWPHMTILQHLRYVVRHQNNAKSNSAEKVDKLLEAVKLNHHSSKYPHQLSGGEQQRLAILRSLAQEPDYLLMDEPFSNLDPILKVEIQEFISHIQSEFKIGILYVTHNIKDLERITDSIAVMQNGRITQFGRKDDVINGPINEFVQQMLGVASS